MSLPDLAVVRFLWVFNRDEAMRLFAPGDRILSGGDPVHDDSRNKNCSIRVVADRDPTLRFK